MEGWEGRGTSCATAEPTLGGRQTGIGAGTRGQGAGATLPAGNRHLGHRAWSSRRVGSRGKGGRRGTGLILGHEVLRGGGGGLAQRSPGGRGLPTARDLFRKVLTPRLFTGHCNQIGNENCDPTAPPRCTSAGIAWDPRIFVGRNER